MDSMRKNLFPCLVISGNGVLFIHLTANLLSNDNKLKIIAIFLGGSDGSYIIHQMHTTGCSWSREKHGKECVCTRGKTFFFLQKVVISVTVCTE